MNSVVRGELLRLIITAVEAAASVPSSFTWQRETKRTKECQRTSDYLIMNIKG